MLMSYGTYILLFINIKYHSILYHHVFMSYRMVHTLAGYDVAGVIAGIVEGCVQWYKIQFMIKHSRTYHKKLSRNLNRGCEIVVISSLCYGLLV